MEEEKKKVLAFLKAQLLGVVSTVDKEGHTPESATVAFAETEHLELMFGTAETTRKFRNIERNRHVSFVIANDKISVQYEGVARILTREEAKQAAKVQIAKNPRSAKYAKREDQRYLKVTPRWIRFTDLSQDPEVVFEIAF